MPAAIRLGDPISCGDTVGQGSGNVMINGLPAARVGLDLTAGHCFSPVAFAAGSGTIMVNGMGLARVGDPIATHNCGNSSHGGNAANGSPTVFADG